MYNKELIQALEERFGVLHGFLLTSIDRTDDIYSHIASIMYNKPYEDCCEWKDNKPYPAGKELRNRVKQFLLSIVIECGGISDDTDNIKKMVAEHRQQATHLRDYVHDSNEDIDSENNSELLDQALDCDQIANWLEELLSLREDKNSSKTNL